MAATLADVQQRVLPNGLRVLVREDHASPVVALNFWVRVGSNNETGDLMGWSHGIEHMLFKGTSKRPTGAIAREIQNAGGETNAGTGYETTNYYIVVPKEEFRTALDIHADVLRNSLFDPVELENERQVLIEENQMYRDRPSGYGITWEELFRLGFQRHRYQSPIGGPDANLRETSRERIVAYKERYYAPANIVYVITGDVTAEDAFRAVEEQFGDWTGGPADHDISPEEPEQTEFRFKELEGDVSRVYGKIGFHVSSELAPDHDAVHVLAHVLGVGRSSRLFRNVREGAGLVDSIGVLSVGGFDPGYLVIDFTTDVARATNALTAIFAEVGRLVREPVSESDLSRSRTMVKSDYVFGLETVEGQASILGHYATLGALERAFDYPDRVAQVTARDVQEAARRYFGVSKASVLLYRPRGSAPLVDDPARLEARLSAAAQGVAGGAPERRAQSAVAGPSANTFAVTRTRLDNGLTLLVDPQPGLPIVAFAAYFRTGSGEESEATSGTTHLLQQLRLKGAGGRTAEALSRDIESMGAHLRPFAGRDVSGVSLSVLKDRLDEALPIFEDVLLRPDFPAAELERERAKTLADIAALRDNSLQYTLQKFSEALYDGHPYGLPVLGRAESVPGIDRAALANWNATRFVPERMVVAVTGDISVAEAQDRVARSFGGMTPGAPTPPVPRTKDTAVARRLVLEKDVAQSVIVLGWPGPAQDSEDRHALDLLVSVLSGMGNRLFSELRDRQHLCYFTGAFASTLAAGGMVGAYIGTRPENEETAITGLLSELGRIREEPPTDEEMQRAKNTIAGGYVIDLQRRAARASLLAQDEVLGLGYDEALRYLDRIKAVTAAEVREAAARWFQLDTITLAVMKPGTA
jgi:zinc protease